MYVVETTIELETELFTLCEKGEVNERVGRDRQQWERSRRVHEAEEGFSEHGFQRARVR